MNGSPRIPIAFGLVLALLVLGGGTAGAQSGDFPTQIDGPHVLTEKKVRLSKDGDNVIRSGPGNTFAIVGVYSKGSEFLVIAKRDEWYNLRLSDTNTGWVHSSLCDEFDDMSDLEFRPNPKLFSRVGSFALTAYTGGYAFDRKSNSLVFGGRVGYYLFEFIEVEGSAGYTHVVRPAEIVESLFGLTLEEEDFHMLFYAMNLTWKILPGRQLVPFATGGAGSSIMQGETETSFNFGVGADFFVKKSTAVRFEFRNYLFDSGVSETRRDNLNFEFSVGLSYLL
ncbi:MAG TPA: outer membrane beta-barrel domain-containing protein [Candidatus Krumholzibacteria bacterium]|nr:outer membrane beta-barrel domain-containing protein [Candidatus Krumholzibacteria bacterium]